MFIQRLPDDALPPENGGDDDPLYQTELAVERDRALPPKWTNGKPLRSMTGSVTPPRPTPVSENQAAVRAAMSGG